MYLHSVHHSPMGRWRVPTAVDEGISTPPAISVSCHGPRARWKGTKAIVKGLSFLCETSLCLNSLQICKRKLEFT